MNHKTSKKVMFLSKEIPWPAYSGAHLRTLGLLKELSKAFEVELVVLSRKPLSSEQSDFLQKYTKSVSRVPLKSDSLQERLYVIEQMGRCKLPYHCAQIRASFEYSNDILSKIHNFPGVVFTNMGHWGTLVVNKRSPNWILNQCDADVDFWRVYASQVPNYIIKLAVLVNWKLADKHFRHIYSHVGRIISVCEEDRHLTLALSPQAQVDIIENGVDCSFYTPDRPTTRTGVPRLLFTGTSARRNMTALYWFVRNVFPLIQHKIPNIEFVIGGNFSQKAQAKFKAFLNICFTGPVNDIRPIFNQCDVYVAPFQDTHGSKLKIAEAMAMAMPIVSTLQGIRGFALKNGESVLIAKDEKQFAEHAVRLLKDPPLRKRVGSTARDVALSTTDWNVLGKRLVDIVASVQRRNL